MENCYLLSGVARLAGLMNVVHVVELDFRKVISYKSLLALISRQDLAMWAADTSLVYLEPASPRAEEDSQ